MPRELEAKVKVDRHHPYRQRLESAGAKPIGAHLETNTFFDTEDRSLLASDKGLRLRVSRDPDGETERAVVTYKGPRQPSVFKSREESETSVGDADTFARILTSLGFKQRLSFEKKRESWTLGECKIELDELPHLGCYVEVEGPDEATIRAAQKTLGLDGPLVRESYAGMLTTWLAERGSREKVVTFPREQ